MPSTHNCDTLSSCLPLRLWGVPLLEHCSTLFPALGSKALRRVMRLMQIRQSSKLQIRLACLHCCHCLAVSCQCPDSLCWLQQAEQEFRAKVEAALEANEVDEDQLIEERRRRRQEILAKHRQGQAQAPQPGAHLHHFFSNHYLRVASWLASVPLQSFLSTSKLLYSQLVLLQAGWHTLSR